MNTDAPRPPLPRWIWITGAAVVAAAVVVGVVLWAQRPTDGDATPTTPATTEPSSAPGTDPDVVTGCLAEGKGVEMLLATQEAAPHSEAGAVEFATAALRWNMQWPWPPAEDWATVTEKTWTGADGFDQAQYDALVAGPNASGGVIAEGTPFHLTSVLGRWYVDSYDGDSARVTVGAAYVVGDAVSPVYRALGTYDLEWTDAGWKTASLSKTHTVQELFDDGLGTTYVGGC